MRQAIVAAAAEVGASIDVDEVLDLWDRFELDAPALDLVAALRRAGHRCYVVTNQQDVRTAPMRRRYGNALDGYFFSCELGEAKPAQDFFVRVLSALAIAPGECVFFDDSAANVLSARDLGILSYLVAEDTGALGGALVEAGLLSQGSPATSR